LLVVYSAKRTAMLAVLLSSAIYIYYTYVRGQGRRISLAGILLAIILTIVATYVFVLVNESSGGYLLERFENIEKDQGSGRLEIYQYVLDMFAKSPLELKLVGHGHNMVKPLNPLDLSAH